MGKPRSPLADLQRGEMIVDKSDRFYLDPDQVRKVELVHQPPGREDVRVTVEYVTGEARVLTVHKSLLATVLEHLYAAARGKPNARTRTSENTPRAKFSECFFYEVGCIRLSLLVQVSKPVPFG